MKYTYKKEDLKFMLEFYRKLGANMFEAYVDTVNVCSFTPRDCDMESESCGQCMFDSAMQKPICLDEHNLKDILLQNKLKTMIATLGKDNFIRFVNITRDCIFEQKECNNVTCSKCIRNYFGSITGI